MDKHDKFEKEKIRSRIAKEMEMGRRIILACHSLLNDRKKLLKKIVVLEKENKKLKSLLTKQKRGVKFYGSK